MALQVRLDDHVATLQVAGAAHLEVADALDELAWDGEARVVVLALEEATAVAPGDDPGAALLRVERAPLPLVVSLRGHVHGPALDLALAADIRVCARDTVMQFSTIGGRRMTAVMGLDRQVELLENGLRCDANLALELGLASRVAEDGDAAALAERVARTIASRGPVAVRLAKEAIWRGRELPLEHALRFETDLTLLLQTTKDRAEGVRAFLEKRQPVFTGE